MNMIEKAKEFTIKAHYGQTSLDGTPFYLHPEKVAKLAFVLRPDDEDFIIAGWFHDILEDTNIKAEEMREKFGDRVTELVLEVTKDSNGKFSNLHTPAGYALKSLDRAANLSRLETCPWTEEEKEDYMKKTRFEW